MLYALTGVKEWFSFYLVLYYSARTSWNINTYLRVQIQTTEYSACKSSGNSLSQKEAFLLFFLRYET